MSIEPEAKPQEIVADPDLFIPAESGDGEPNPDDLVEEDLKVIDKRVSKMIDPIIRDSRDTKNRLAVKTLLEGEDGEVYKPYADKILEYANDSRLAGLSFEAKAKLAVPAADWKKWGAEQEKKAAAAAEASRGVSGGGRINPISSELDIRKMSRQEFANFQEQIIAQRR